MSPRGPTPPSATTKPKEHRAQAARPGRPPWAGGELIGEPRLVSDVMAWAGQDKEVERFYGKSGHFDVAYQAFAIMTIYFEEMLADSAKTYAR